MEEISIKQINLPVRALNVLRKMNVLTVGTLLETSIEEISKQRNVGAKTITEISTFIEQMKNGDLIIESISTGKRTETLSFRPNQIEEMSCHVVEELLLTTRSYNALKKNGFANIAEIAVLSIDDLGNIKSLGAKSKQDIIEARERWLQEHGMVPLMANEILEETEEDTYFKEICRIIRPIGKIYWADLKRFVMQSDIWEKIIYGGYENIDNNNLITLFELPELYPVLQQCAIKFLSDKLVTEKEFYFILESFQLVFNPQIIIDRLLELKICNIMYGYIIVNRQNINEYLESISDQLEERVYSMIYFKLDGETLQTIGELFGVTRERVRQVVSKQIPKFPLLVEDYFRIPFESFFIDKKDILILFPKISKWGYEYLSQRYKRGKQKLSEETIKNYNGPFAEHLRAFCVENKNWNEKSRIKLVYKVLMSNSDTSVTMEKFEELYNQYMLDNGYDRKKLELNPRSLTNHLRTAKNIVFNKNNRFRYLKVDCELIGKEIDFSLYKNLVISTELIWNDYQDLMNEYDIRDGHELYCLIKTAEDFTLSNNISCRRIPTLIIGDGSEEKQALHLLKELSPIDYYHYYTAYEDRYGIKKESALGNPRLSHFLSNYLSNGVYAIDVPTIDDKDIKAFINALDVSKIWFIDDLEKLFEKVCVNSAADALNAASFIRIGYTLHSGYAYKSSYGSVTNFFEGEIFSEDIIDLVEVDPRLMGLSVFTSALDKKKKLLNYIEVSPKVLFSMKKITEDYGLSLKELQDIQTFLTELATDEYFNAQSIWNETSNLPEIKRLNSNTWMCTCIMRQQEGICSLRVAGNIILSRNSDKMNLQSVCKWIAQQYGKMSLSNITNKINELFGSTITTWKIAEKVKSSGSWDEIIAGSLDEYIDALIDNSNVEEDFFQEEFF